MTTLFTVRRRAEEFAAAVDSDARSADAHNAEVDHLVGVVSAMRAHQDTIPRQEFASDLRDRLTTEAERVLTAANAGLALPVRARGARERRLVAAASAVVLIGGTAGMAAAAQNALPGEALYPIKRGIERAEAGLSMSQAGKGQDLLHQATDRLNEVQGLLSKDPVQSTPQVPETLDEFSQQATEGADLLLGSFQETRDPSAVIEVRTFAGDGIKLLEQLAENVPPEAQDELAAAAETLRDIDEQAAAMCSTCATDMPDLQIPGLILARSEVDRALGMVPSTGLDNSHPVVVPKGTVHKNRVGKTSESGDSTQPDVKDPGSDPTDGAAEVPSTDGLDPDDLPTLALPGTDEQVSGGKKDPAEAPTKAGTDLTGGLSGVVETLLPDTDVENPLP